MVAAQQGTTVSVEKLFKNLPVRRKELEKNLKREYAKVLNLLQAYACISTNVRFAVSNQMPKGKKTVAFATNSNPSTRENIANVYGAKTLSALVALELRFEMKSNGGPALKSLLKDATSDAKEVHIQGHISKPIFGEGRQAPDRQMFFVNSRPCGLPQVAKAFNEVYKGFNMSQSPFVFANLFMDTNAYDVNVSPDKRTILLHDQTELLESLKEALTKLFDAQDQTVPTSQLQSKKLPMFKQPSVLRSQSTQGSSDAGSTTREGSPLFESQAPDVNGGRSQTSLIHAWAGRDTVNRDAVDNRHQNSHHTSDQTPSLPLEWNKPNEDTHRDPTEITQMSSANDSAYREASPQREEPDVNATHISDAPTELARSTQAVTSRGSKDIDKSLKSPAAKKFLFPSRVTTETVQLDDDMLEANKGTQDSSDDQQEPIAAIRTPTRKSVNGPIQNAFDRMRPKRLQEEITTVTVGDQTTVMTLGSDYKRRRIHTPKTGGHAGGLTSSLRAFAAPGTQMSQEAADSPDEEDQADESQSDASSMGEVEDESQTMSLEESVRSHTKSPSERSVASSEESEDEYLDEAGKKAKEDARVAKLISEAEALTTAPTEATLKRASQVFRSSKRREATLDLTQTLSLNLDDLRSYDGFSHLPKSSSEITDSVAGSDESQDAAKAEAKLSLTISKADFARMRIVGQFNLGFILASRPSNTSPSDDIHGHGQDHLFIIDQHAADEKFNFERLSATTTLTPQRLVTPKELQLSAVEEELIASNQPSLEANGFQIEILPPSSASGGRATHRLLTLPTSKETTFSPADLEELLHLLSESASSSSTIVRPSRVRRMLAMRACRSSIMVGRTLASSRMEEVVKNMGRMDRPWNCPHGRPTMRHLAGLKEWSPWNEDGGKVDWRGYV